MTKLTKLSHPTPQQEAICDWWDNESGHGVLRAIAGAAKTTSIHNTIAHALISKPDLSYICTAFNVHNAKDLQNKGLNARTLNSLGFSLLKTITTNKLVLDRNKYTDILKTYEWSYDTRNTYVKAFHLLRNSLLPITVENIEYIVDFYNIALPTKSVPKPEDVFNYLQSRGEFLFRKGLIDYNDQVVLPLEYADQLYIPDYDLVALDEAQDLSPAQIKMCLLYKKEYTRFLIAYDEYQSIQGFTGAHTKTTSLLLDELKPTRLSLTISFRCPKAVVESAKEYVSDFDVHENAIEGEILHWTSTELMDYLLNLDNNNYPMIICRINNPIVSLCLRLIASGLPAKVKGRDVGEAIVSIVRKVEKKANTKKYGKALTHDNFTTILDIFKQDELKKAKKSENKIEAIQDKYDCILAIYHYCLTSNDIANSIVNFVHTIFDDSLENVIELSSIHKAKGLEKDTVVFYRRDLCPSIYAKTEDAKQQERNLIYVAITRTKNKLIYVD